MSGGLKENPSTLKLYSDAQGHIQKIVWGGGEYFAPPPSYFHSDLWLNSMFIPKSLPFFIIIISSFSCFLALSGGRQGGGPICPSERAPDGCP